MDGRKRGKESPTNCRRSSGIAATAPRRRTRGEKRHTTLRSASVLCTARTKQQQFGNDQVAFYTTMCSRGKNVRRLL